jgi:hypothetical protein
VLLRSFYAHELIESYLRRAWSHGFERVQVMVATSMASTGKAVQGGAHLGSLRGT